MPSDKDAKFGRFMGKLLLKKKVTTSASTTSISSTTLYPGYLRAERRRKHETDKGENLLLPECTHWLKVDLKKKNLNSDNSLPSSSLSPPSPQGKKFRHNNGKRTRWDVPQSQDKDASPPLPLETKTNSLKPMPTGLHEDEDSCQDCYIQAMKRKSLDVIELCDQCKKKWTVWPKIFFSLLQDTAAATNTHEQQQNHQNDMDSEKKSPSTTENQLITKNKSSTGPTKKATPKSTKATVRRRRTAKPPPPAKSRNTHRNNPSSSSQAVEASDTVVPTPVGDTMALSTTTSLPLQEMVSAKQQNNTFSQNIHGYTYQQQVEVLNINGHWYAATLVETDGGKIKVHYQDWDDQDEWIIMGSQRLRTLATTTTTKTTSAPEKGDEDNQAGQDSASNNTDNDDDDDDSSSTMSDYHDDDKDLNKNTSGLSSMAVNTDTLLEGPGPYPIPLTSNTDPLLEQSYQQQESKNKPDKDYVTSTLDTDPAKIFNNNEVFMTRRMARQMVDEHGFCPNSFGYHYGRAVAVTYETEGANKKKQHMEWVGYLRQMRGNQVRIWFPASQQSDWMLSGSRRLRLLSEQEDADYRTLGFDITGDDGGINKQKTPAKPSRRRCPQAATSTSPATEHNNDQRKHHQTPISTSKVSTTQSTDVDSTVTPAKTQPNVNSDNLAGINDTTMDGGGNMKPKNDKLQRKHKSAARTNKTSQKPKNNENQLHQQEFLTTGAFATRRTMRQLQDEHGFVPNPYGYTYDMAVEILNTKSSKHQFFWERGRLVGMRPGKVRVRYDGWGEIYDEWIMVGSRRIRLVQSTTETPQDESNNKVLPSSSNDTSPLDQSSSSICAVSSSSTSQHNVSTDKGGNNSHLLETNFLLMETNPELEDQGKNKKRQRQILGPDDYHRLGMMISIEELEEKERKRQKRRSEQLAQVGGHPDSSNAQPAPLASVTLDGKPSTTNKARKTGTGAKQSQQSRKQQRRKQRRRRQNDLYLSDSNEEDGDADEDDDDDYLNALQEDDQGNSGGDENATKDGNDDPHHGFVANVYGYDYMQHVQLLHLDKKWYEGRLISMDRNRLRVHYCGWPDLFDEYVTVGSRRLQVVENDHEVECLEPGYMTRYEDILKNKHLHQGQHRCGTLPSTSGTSSYSTKLRRLTLANVGDEDPEEDPANAVSCHRCNVVIKQFRYYCTYCESSIGQDEFANSFDLCLQCFDHNFPFWHEHPRSSFAVQSVIDTDIGPRPIKGELVTVWEEDVMGDEDSMQAPTNVLTSDILFGNQEATVDQTTSSAAPLTPISTPPTTMITAPLTSTPTIPSPESSSTNLLPLSPTKTGSTTLEASQIFSGQTSIGSDQGYKYLKRWQRRKVCSFCNDDDDTSEDLGKFIGPFVITSFNKNGTEKKRSFWVHDACARHSPEVFCTPEGKWYNVTLALRRGRAVRCFGCKEKGATIGCFESKCNKSFHLPCAQRPVNYFENGVIFWCPTHEAYYNKIDTYVNVFSCDGCNKKLEEDSWYTCLPCASSYFSSFDLCADCYENFPQDHAHGEDQFEETSFEIIKEMEAQKATEAARAKEEVRENNAKNRKKPTFMKRKRRRADGTTAITCCYCGIQDADEWRKGYDGGVLMCVTCYNLALLVDNDGRPGDNNYNEDREGADSMENDSWGATTNEPPLVFDPDQPHQYLASIDEYTHKPYLTRDALSATKFSDTLTGARLATYEPQPNQLFSLIFASTYYDIPGRAPRWASHSGTDYHGTWLPQTVRRSILKYTKKNERILSNFLGRGTDAIECFLLQRRCTGIDINPAAVTLSQRNCCFELPIGITEAKYRPIVCQADARSLSGSLFGDESFHHILSHPPYKDCVAYSTHLEGDLSRFNNIDDFKVEYENVVKQSWRVLKMGRRLTLGIGDNREHCFYIPVSFQLMRQYINEGFEMEEMIVKRQRYCSAFGLGTYLCVQFDFLVFTHEFLATFRKVPREKIDTMARCDDNLMCGDSVQVTRTLRGVPSSAISRKSVVMGTVWVFRPKEQHSFSKLCMSRMVERFGKDDCNWEHVQFMFTAVEENTIGSSCIVELTDEEAASDEVQQQSEDESSLSNYEQERLKRIDENNKILLKLGLVSELGEESEDTIHYDNMINKPSQEEAPLCIVIMEHPEENVIKVNQIGLYRQTVVEAALKACDTLAPLGMFIVGTQDIRDPDTGKLWPMSMLILEDIEGAVDRSILKLKEMVVTVPEGHSRNRKLPISEAMAQYQQQEEEDEQAVIIVDGDNDGRSSDHLPIVHAIYLIFQRL
ncbi:hypothetical protein BC941DRAFT_415299 [Chlamydoabsidia padenii]|nr:hypothetical protein BC941DRAFT_415299 [Chlamydoabsidia padenii]